MSIPGYENQQASDSKSPKALKTGKKDIDAKLDRVADAIELMGLSDTLRNHIPGLVDVWQDIVEVMTHIASNPYARASDVQDARAPDRHSVH